MKPESPSVDPIGPEEWEALARYVAGESDPSEAAEVEQWLAADPRRDAWLRSLDGSLDRLQDRRAGELDVEGALARVLERTDQADVIPLRPVAQPERSHGWGVVLQIAAALVLLVGGGWLLMRVAGDGVMAGPLASAEVVATGVGERSTVTLADGTEVVLGPMSRMETRDGYGGDSRTVDLTGQAVFRVVHDEQRPFIVIANGLEIRDLGTVFSVRALTDQPVTVAVAEGEVEMTGGSAAEPPILLEPGDRAVVQADGQQNVQRGVSVEADLAWSTGQLVFEDQPLRVVAEDLGRWYGLEVRFADPTLAERRLTATFDGDPTEQVARVIGLALDVPARIEGSTLTLGSPPQ